MIMGSLNSSEFFCACLFDCPDATHHVTRMSDFLVHLHDCSRCRIDNFFVFFFELQSLTGLMKLIVSPKYWKYAFIPSRTIAIFSMRRFYNIIQY